MAINEFDLNDAALFAKVVEKSSFSGAARTLGVPVSSVSRKVARLEENLGTRLLHRTTRKLSLTDAGRTYHSMISKGLEQLEAASEAVSDLQGEPNGRIRFTTVPGVGRYAWNLIEDFMVEHPKVTVEIDLTERTVDMVEGGYDLALRAGALPDSSLISKRLLSSPFAMYAAPCYLERAGTPERVEDLSRHQCIVRGLSSRGVTWRLRSGRKQRDVAVSGRLAVTSVETVMRACTRGLGIAMLPVAMTGAFEERGRLTRVLPSWEGPSAGLWLVYPSRQHLSPTVRAMIDFLSERIDIGIMSSEKIYAWHSL